MSPELSPAPTIYEQSQQLGYLALSPELEAERLAIVSSTPHTD